MTKLQNASLRVVVTSVAALALPRLIWINFSCCCSAVVLSACIVMMGHQYDAVNQTHAPIRSIVLVGPAGMDLLHVLPEHMVLLSIMLTAAHILPTAVLLRLTEVPGDAI